MSAGENKEHRPRHVFSPRPHTPGLPGWRLWLTEASETCLGSSPTTGPGLGQLCQRFAAAHVSSWHFRRRVIGLRMTRVSFFFPREEEIYSKIYSPHLFKQVIDSAKTPLSSWKQSREPSCWLTRLYCATYFPFFFFSFFWGGCCCFWMHFSFPLNAPSLVSSRCFPHV